MGSSDPSIRSMGRNRLEFGPARRNKKRRKEKEKEEERKEKHLSSYFISSNLQVYLHKRANKEKARKVNLQNFPIQSGETQV